MFKVVFLTTIVIVTILTIRANDANESECREELEQEVQEYVKLDSWQMLFKHHFKFIVNESGDVLSERKRLKLNTIIHNAINGCNHNRDDEVDDCPNIYRGSVKTCKHGKGLRTAMFRAARCNFAELSVKHIVLSDALLNTYPSNEFENISDNADKPIRQFGETVVNMLSTLTHGETGGLGELMTLNLYLNNRFGTVFIYKVPVEPVTSSVDLEIARKHAHDVHKMILDKLYTFWNTWCSDRDIVSQYRLKYHNDTFIVLSDEMDKNNKEADDFVRSLNVSDHDVDLDFDPKKIVLSDYVESLISNKSMPVELLTDVRIKSFEVSYEFNPRAIYEYYNTVFRTVYTCFYWETITHLKLGVQIIDKIEQDGTKNYRMSFVVPFFKFVKPLTVFDINRSHFVSLLSPNASRNLYNLRIFLLKFYYYLRNKNVKEVILHSRPTINKFVDLLKTDLETMLKARAPTNNYHFYDYGYEKSMKLMKSNYHAFARLVSATSGFKKDRMNAIKLKKTMHFLSEAIDFNTN